VKPRRLHVVGALIMLSWFASLGWLVRRQYYSDGYPAGVTTSNRLAPGTRFYAVYGDGVQVGTASLSADTVPGGGARIVTRFDIGTRDSLRSRLQTLMLTPALELTEWSASSTGEPTPFEVHGARGTDRIFHATLTEGDDTLRAVPLEPGRALPLFAAALRASLNAIFSPGDTLVLPVLDPYSATIGEIRLRSVPARGPLILADSAALDPATGKWVAALTDTVPARLLVQLGMDAPVRLWLDGEGFPLRAELPDGLVLERTAFEIANLNFRNGDRPGGPRVRLRRHLASEGDPVLPEDSAPTLVFPAQDPAVAALLGDAASGAETRADTIAALARWIGRRIRTGRETDDAVATLDGRAGSAVGRARLFVAAARGAGIPTRLAFGVRQDSTRWTAVLLPEAYIDAWRQVDLEHGRVFQDSSVRKLRLRTSGFPFEHDALLASFTRHQE
jgi:hypothetical protein